MLTGGWCGSSPPPVEAARATSRPSQADSTPELAAAIASGLARLQKLCSEQAEQVAQQQADITRLLVENGRLRASLDCPSQIRCVPSEHQGRIPLLRAMQEDERDPVIGTHRISLDFGDALPVHAAAGEPVRVGATRVSDAARLRSSTVDSSTSLPRQSAAMTTALTRASARMKPLESYYVESNDWRLRSSSHEESPWPSNSALRHSAVSRRGSAKSVRLVDSEGCESMDFFQSQPLRESAFCNLRDRAGTAHSDMSGVSDTVWDGLRKTIRSVREEDDDPGTLVARTVVSQQLQDTRRVMTLMRWQSLVTGLLRPMSQFTAYDVWTSDFATGQRGRSATFNVERAQTSKLDAPRQRQVQKAPSLYDLDEEDRTCWSRVVIHPNSRFRLMWVILSVLFVMYDVAMAPFQAFFDVSFTFWQTLLMWICAVFWTFDMMFSFLTGVYVEGILDFSFKTICFQYFRTWFVFDISLITLDWINCMEGVLNDFNEESDAPLHNLARFFRILRLLRISRIGKLGVILGDIFSMTSQGVIHYTGMAKIIVVFIIGIHISACFWYGIGIEEGGWVHREQLDSVDIARAYFVSVNWVLAKMIGGASTVSLEPLLCTHLELYGSLIAGCLGLAAVTVLIAQTVNAVACALDIHSWEMQQTCCRYLLDRKISPALATKAKGYASAFYRTALRRDYIQQENELVKIMPESLQIDLHEEARGRVILHDTFFLDLNDLSRGALRELSHIAMTDLFIASNEVVFYAKSVCTRTLFLDHGAMRYTVAQDCRSGARNVGRLTFSTIIDAHKLVSRGECISEAVLWTKWQHCGELFSTANSRTISMTAEDFAKVIKAYSDVYALASKYARKFVWYLNENHDQRTDMMRHGLRLTHTDDDQWEDEMNGSVDDHYIFLSHYKVEAGTEATLMMEELKTIIQKDPYHPGNRFRVPVFLDSENLTDLTVLRDEVKKSHNLVLLLTPGVFSRPWCLVEIATAVASGQRIVPVEVQRPGMRFEYPDEEFYLNLRTGRALRSADLRLLQEQGIELTELEQAIKSIFRTIAQPFSPHKNAHIRQAELWAILSRCDKNTVLGARVSLTVTGDESIDKCKRFSSDSLGGIVSDDEAG